MQSGLLKTLFSWTLEFTVAVALGLVFSFLIPCVSCAHGDSGDMHEGTTGVTQDYNTMHISELILSAKAPDGTSAQENADAEKPGSGGEHNKTIWKEIEEGFSYTFRTFGYGRAIEPSDSTQNPDNDLLNIPGYSLNLDLRPDMSLNFRRLTLVAKPRLDLKWERWEKGGHEGDTDTDDDWYINEWLASLNLINGLFVSYGRENIQWGPSSLISPSNPFFSYNGQANPKAEIPGKDFARLIWVANSSWTASFLANLGRGRAISPYDFKRTYALKLDYTGYQKYLSLIGSYQEDNRCRLGAFGGWWVSDAMLLYAEGSVSQGTNALYPEKDNAAPFGIQMSPAKDDDNSPEGLITVGGSYTLKSGATFTLEYFFNSPGYNDDEAGLYYDLRGRAAEAFYSPEPRHSVSQMTLMQTLDPGLRFLRRNYLTFQYYQIEIRDVLNLILRYTYNVDDSSSRLIPIIEYDIGDHFQVFLVGDQRFGSKDSEFRSLIDYSYMLGVEFTF